MQKLELTWMGKGQDLAVEPRILLHDASKDYGDPAAENMLIHGDNLLALKALEQEFTGKVKCIYIDPPFNTEQAFEHYDDNLEISIWLGLMNERLKIINHLLANDGTLFIHIDDGNLANLVVMTDEVFGRKNRLYIITFKQGSATGHKAINPGCVNTTNYLVMYAKDKTQWTPNRVFTSRERDSRYNQFIKNIEENHKKWNITTLTAAFAKYLGVDIKEARKVIKDKPDLLDQFVMNNCNAVIRTARPDYNGVGYEVKQKIDESSERKGEIFHLTRINNPDMYFLNGERILFYKDKLKKIDNEYVAGEPLTTLWDDILSNNLHNEGGVSFPKGKKPEFLIKRVLELVTSPADLVLDSFLGSGTTSAVAHKMGRRWIGIELGDHYYTHCLPRLKAVVDGEQGGISKAVGWQGGDGFKCYELAPTLIVRDKHGNPIMDTEKYNPEMLAAAVAKLNGFVYSPDKEVFWKQGQSVANSYIFVTTQYMTSKELDEISSDLADYERLLICAHAFDVGLGRRYENIDVKKIPQSVLNKCEYGVDNYNLNIVEVPDFEEGDLEDDVE